MALELHKSDRQEKPSTSGCSGLLRKARISFGSLAMVATFVTSGSIPVHAAQSHHAQPRVIEHETSLTARRPLLAHVRFCVLYQGQCDVHPDRRRADRTERENLAEVIRVNRSVNRAIIPRPDQGADSWDINVSHGDCEDYALQKRAELIALGWPTEALRIAVVRMRDGGFHAVLLVQVGDTDYVLDNLTSRVMRWDRTPHRFLMIQDRVNPRAWHDVAPRSRRALVG